MHPKKRTEKKSKNKQVTEAASQSGNKSIANGMSTEKQNVPVNESNGQTDPQARTQKGSKSKSKTRRPKKVGFFSLFSTKRLVLFYILAVFFWCNGKTQKQCNSYEEAFCFNGISQYILNHDFFHKYIEPAITVVKQNVDVYGKQALNTVSIHYKTRAKSYVDPLFEYTQPHLRTARELSVEYIYNPVAGSLAKAQQYYNDNARDHVDNYYNQAVKLSSPYVSQAREFAREFASYAYEKASEYNKDTFQPLYHKIVVPFKDKAISSAYNTLEIIKKTYYEKIVPAYRNHVKPLFQGDKSEAEKETKAETEKRAKAEADRKVKEEADRKAKEEADRKAKEEADRKVKEEADRKAKEEADRKAEEEAERKAEEEADRNAKEEAAAIAVANKAVRDAFNKEFPLVRENLTLALDNYERKATSMAKGILHEVEDRIAILKNSGSEHLVNLKKFVERIKEDSTKNNTTKLNEMLDSAKDKIDKIKEISQEFIEISQKSFDNLEKEKFDKLKKEFSLYLLSQVFKAKNDIYDQAGDKKIDDKLKTDIDMTVNDILKESNANKNSASLRVREIFTLINNEIELLTPTRDDLIKDIHSYLKIEKEILKGEDNKIIDKKAEKNDNKNADTPNVESNSVKDAHKDDKQIPVQVEEQPITEGKASDIITVQASSDPVLEKLKARQDLILNKLKKGYESSSKAQVQSVDNEEDDYDEYDEESDECSSEDQ